MQLLQTYCNKILPKKNSLEQPLPEVNEEIENAYGNQYLSTRQTAFLIVPLSF